MQIQTSEATSPNSAQSMATIAKEASVEAYHSIVKVERYFASLCRAYKIIRAEIPESLAGVVLQAVVKAMNNTTGRERLLPTSLVLGTWYGTLTVSAPSPDTRPRAEAIAETVKKLHQLQTQ